MKTAVDHYMEARSDEELNTLAEQYADFEERGVLGDCLLREVVEGLYGDNMFAIHALSCALALYKVKAQRAEAMLEAQSNFMTTFG